MIVAIIKKYFKILVSTMLITALGCAMMYGLSGAHKSLKTTLDGYIKDYNYPDSIVTTNVSTIDKIESLKEIKDINEYNTRLVIDTTMISPEGKYLSSRLLTYDTNSFTKIYEWDSIDTKEDSIYMEYNFANDNNIKVGDNVKFKVNDEYREYKVSKIISLPETLSTQITDKVWGENSDFGYVYVPIELLIKETNILKDKQREEVNNKEVELNNLEDEATEKYNEANSKLKNTLNKLENEYKLKKNDALRNLRLLKDNLKKLKDARTELNKQRTEIISTKESINNGIITLEKNKKDLISAKNGLEEIDNALNEIETEYGIFLKEETKNTIEILKFLPRNMSIYKVYVVCNQINNYINILEGYGIHINIDEPCNKVADNLSSIVYEINDDYAYLNDIQTLKLVSDIKQGKEVDETEHNKLLSIIKKYDTKNYEDIEESYKNAQKINSDIYNYTSENKVLNMAVFIHELNGELTFSKLLNNINSCYDAAISKMDNTDDISNMTVGEFIDKYYELVNAVESKKSELENSRKEIVDKLNENGIQESDIPTAIVKIDENISDLKANLGKLEDMLSTIDDKGKEVDENIELLNTQISNIDSAMYSGEQDYITARNKILSSQRQVNNEWINSKKQFSDAREELIRALEDIENRAGYEEYFNQILFRFKDSKNQDKYLDSIIRKINDIEDLEVKSSYTYENSPVKNRININLEPIETMSVFIPIVFFVIILGVVFLFMSLLIKQCRREIGILRAEGYTKTKICVIFLLINLIVSVLAIVLGTGIGTALMLYVGKYYQNFFPLPMFNYGIDWKMYISAIALTIAIGQIATFIATINIGKIEPTEIMSRETPNNVEVPRWLEIFTKRAKPLTKFSLVTLLRNKLKFILSVVSVSASVMIIFSSLSFISSKNYILDELYNKRINYDAQIFMSEQPKDEVLEKIKEIDGVSNVQLVDYFETVITANGNKDDVLINAMDKDSNLVGIYDSNNNKIEIPETGIILEKHTADKLKVKKGDTVNIEGINLEVKEISNQSINRIQYISKNQAKDIGTADYETILLDISSENHQKLLGTLIEDENYLYTLFTDLSYESNAKIFATYDIGAWIIIGFAIVIGFVIVLNNAYTNLISQKKKLCMLRVLGFQHNEISWNWLHQSFIQWIISCIIGLPCGVGIAKMALARLSTESREYVFANGIKENIITIFIVLLYMIISHLVIMRIFKNWNITENVKDKE